TVRVLRNEMTQLLELGRIRRVRRIEPVVERGAGVVIERGRGLAQCANLIACERAVRPRDADEGCEWSDGARQIAWTRRALRRPRPARRHRMRLSSPAVA